jgi:hypothetical protein
MDRIIRASESTPTVTDRACPVCSVILDTPKALQNHIALHLERFSLFSLPRSTGSNGDELSGSKSDVAQGVVAGSRDDDFDGDLEIESHGPNDADLDMNPDEVSDHSIEVTAILGGVVSTRGADDQRQKSTRTYPLGQKSQHSSNQPRHSPQAILHQRTSGELPEGQLRPSRTTTPPYMPWYSPRTTSYLPLSQTTRSSGSGIW